MASGELVPKFNGISSFRNLDAFNTAVKNANTEDLSRIIYSSETFLDEGNLINGIEQLISEGDFPLCVETIAMSLNRFDLGISDIEYKTADSARPVSILIHAAECERHETVLMLLDHFTSNSVCVQDKKQNSILHYAAQHGWIDVMEKTLELNKVILNVPNIDNDSAFLIAGKLGNKDIVDFLFNKYPTLCVQDAYEQYTTVTGICIENDWSDLFPKILKRDKRKLEGNIGGMNDPYWMLHAVVLRYILATFEEQRVIYLRSLMDVFPNLLSSKYFHDMNPIIWAAESNYKQATKYLFASVLAEDLRKAQNKAKMTLLHLAIQNEWIEMCEDILRKNKIVIPDEENKGNKLTRAIDANSRTPILLSAFLNKRKIFNILMKHLLSFNDTEIFTISDNHGRNVVHYCVMNGWLKECTNILEKEKDLLNYQDHKGMSPIMMSVKHCQAKIFRELLRRDAIISHLDSDGHSVFHLIVDVFGDKYDWSENINELLKSKTVSYLLNVKDKAGQTPIMRAAEKEHKKCVMSFVGFTSNFDGRFSGNLNLAHMCVEKDWDEVLQSIVEKEREDSNLWDEKNEKGFTPLELARSIKRTKCVSVLEALDRQGNISKYKGL